MQEMATTIVKEAFLSCLCFVLCVWMTIYLLKSHEMNSFQSGQIWSHAGSMLLLRNNSTWLFCVVACGSCWFIYNIVINPAWGVVMAWLRNNSPWTLEILTLTSVNKTCLCGGLLQWPSRGLGRLEGYSETPYRLILSLMREKGTHTPLGLCLHQIW